MNDETKHYRTPHVVEEHPKPLPQPSWIRRVWWALRREWDASYGWTNTVVTMSDTGQVARETVHRNPYTGWISTECKTYVRWDDVPLHWRVVLWPPFGMPTPLERTQVQVGHVLRITEQFETRFRGRVEQVEPVPPIGGTATTPWTGRPQK